MFDSNSLFLFSTVSSNFVVSTWSKSLSWRYDVKLNFHFFHYCRLRHSSRVTTFSSVSSPNSSCRTISVLVDATWASPWVPPAWGSISFWFKAFFFTSLKCVFRLLTFVKVSHLIVVATSLVVRYIQLLHSLYNSRQLGKPYTVQGEQRNKFQM